MSPLYRGFIEQLRQRKPANRPFYSSWVAIVLPTERVNFFLFIFIEKKSGSCAFRPIRTERWCVSQRRWSKTDRLTAAVRCISDLTVCPAIAEKVGCCCVLVFSRAEKKNSIVV